MTVTSGTPGNLPQVTTHRGRPSDYTPEEDAIILQHRNTDDVQRLLREAGFPERTPAAIWSRRKYLNEGGYTEVTAEMLESESHELLPALSARREKLRERLRMLEEEATRLRDEVEHLNREMHAIIFDGKDD